MDTSGPKNRQDLVGIVLAAGRSERMGAFKPLLPFGDKTVIESTIDNLRRGGVETVVVVVGHQHDELRRRLDGANVTFALNPDSRSEMTDSVACGVRMVSDDAKAVIITPVDHPAVPAEVVAQLIREWETGARLVKPSWQDRGGHPVVVDLSFREALLSLDPHRGLKGLFESHPADVSRVPVDSQYIARDMDTWDDYAALHLEIFGRLPPNPIEHSGSDPTQGSSGDQRKG